MKGSLVASFVRWSVACAVVLGLGCSGSSEDANETPERIPASEPARKISRLTALQFHRALKTATGETWSEFEQKAKMMGHPDFRRTVRQNTDLTVSFERAVSDAARQTCSAAVAKDRERPPSEGVILRHVGFEDDIVRNRASVLRNLKYLILRFHGFHIESNDDARLKPWLELLQSTDDIAAGWVGICVGLVTHPDFFTY